MITTRVLDSFIASTETLLRWPQEIPFDGERADVTERVRAYGRRLAESADVPKPLLAVQDGVGLRSPETVRWAREHSVSLEVADIEPAGHQRPRTSRTRSASRSHSG